MAVSAEAQPSRLTEDQGYNTKTAPEAAATRDPDSRKQQDRGVRELTSPKTDQAGFRSPAGAGPNKPELTDLTNPAKAGFAGFSCSNAATDSVTGVDLFPDDSDPQDCSSAPVDAAAAPVLGPAPDNTTTNSRLRHEPDHDSTAATDAVTGDDVLPEDSEPQVCSCVPPADAVTAPALGPNPANTGIDSRPSLVLSVGVLGVLSHLSSQGKSLVLGAYTL